MYVSTISLISLVIYAVQASPRPELGQPRAGEQPDPMWAARHDVQMGGAPGGGRRDVITAYGHQQPSYAVPQPGLAPTAGHGAPGAGVGLAVPAAGGAGAYNVDAAQQMGPAAGAGWHAQQMGAAAPAAPQYTLGVPQPGAGHPQMAQLPHQQMAQLPQQQMAQLPQQNIDPLATPGFGASSLMTQPQLQGAGPAAAHMPNQFAGFGATGAMAGRPASLGAASFSQPRAFGDMARGFGATTAGLGAATGFGTGLGTAGLANQWRGNANLGMMTPALGTSGLYRPYTGYGAGLGWMGTGWNGWGSGWGNTAWNTLGSYATPARAMPLRDWNARMGLGRRGNMWSALGSTGAWGYGSRFGMMPRMAMPAGSGWSSTMRMPAYPMRTGAWNYGRYGWGQLARPLAFSGARTMAMVDPMLNRWGSMVRNTWGGALQAYRPFKA